jgi:DnaK suppressor protein
VGAGLPGAERCKTHAASWSLAQPGKGGDVMKKKDLDFFRKMLERRLEELLEKSDDTIADLLNFTVSAPDPLDRTSLEVNRDFTVRMLDRESKLMAKIKKALQKIDDRTFGVCEVCGEEIDMERLKLRPVTELCIDCKTYQEKFEKLYCE